MEFSQADFDKVLDRTATWSIKWDPGYMVERFGTSDLVPYNHAEMDFECPAPIRKVIQNRSAHGIYGYTLVKEGYYEAVMDWYRRRHGIKYHREEILYSTGVVFSLRNAISYFSRQGDEIALFTPIYRPLAEAVTDQARILLTIPLALDQGRYAIDFNTLRATFQGHHVKMLLFCNPHNPVGRVWTQKELRLLIDLCTEFNVLIVSDEIHCDLLARGHTYTSITEASPDISVPTIALSAMTKTFNTSGLKISNIFVRNPEIRRDYFKFYDKKFIYAPNLYGILATQAAYAEFGPWADLLTRYLDTNFDFVVNSFREAEFPVQVIKREGTPVIWLDFRDFPYPKDKIFQLILTQAHMIGYDGKDFVADGDGFQRLNIGYPKKILKSGIETLCRTLSKIING